MKEIAPGLFVDLDRFDGVVLWVEKTGSSRAVGYEAELKPADPRVLGLLYAGLCQAATRAAMHARDGFAKIGGVEAFDAGFAVAEVGNFDGSFRLRRNANEQG